MKSCVALLCLVGFACALDKSIVSGILKDIEKIGAECVKETSASEDDIAQLNAKKVPTTHEGKCMMFCYAKHFEMMNDDGSLSDAILKKWDVIKGNDEDVYNKLVQVHNTCHSKTSLKADPCDTATDLAVCSLEESSKLGLMEQFA
ncbi:uncharacterized protein LOC132707203 [Cylas formicarius]|uniref:Odorant binding protein n=1 Tax=Cylas formicarius TaxID=197179 RepID=A0A6B7M0E4_CYLFO|nr:uncharacterized protein LOC132707203 [Cylas formicarius]QFO46784.1 odorant binding protein [Cylas formicarius]